ncbi:MAG TPA: hypothetical protein VFI24_11965 [Pyrinomonadaceae bacterium]|nr:hypothetical protein [Pyrinomonadaceae bacterium]
MRVLIIALVLACPVVAGLSASQQKRARHRNRPPAIISVTSSNARVAVCPFTAHLYKPEVELLVDAIDPDGDTLIYEYSTTEGAILGKGKLVTWDLNNVKRGPHEVRATVKDGKGG